ncbi:hypothetical protein DDB_G0277641 [Dictyostelium discoideum AX4]|uniref:hypothetical protein n=1 Tax=Dictyostelium discoideum AX4 TaxID=352472 RepID=UPI00004E4276|nr:hypothetical protein DDB_G0277641 [Dictyostelium discoideum AX4]EAL68638.1 hypothetical protein DDB_G0277641 [Dictyostelium discoideum AX4]|eukprot:XP_642539.1 hypothetical protein DDB_G0277641 [Dictyostelium discoideum AX4]
MIIWFIYFFIFLFFYFFKNFWVAKIKFQLPNEKEDIIKIWEYFNKHSFKQMIPNYDILIEFLSSVTNIIPPLELKISNIKEPLSGKLGTILLMQLYKKNLNVIELLLKSFDNFNFIHQPEQMSAIVDKERNLFHISGELFQVDKKFSFQIIRIIKLIMDKFNKLTKDQINIENISTTTYRLFLNYLYDQLLRVKGLTIDQLEYVRSIIPEQLLNNNFETYRIFFYLNIRSSKLSNYLIKRPGITYFIRNSTELLYNNFYNTAEPITDEIIGFDLRKYLNFELFTYDYILGRELNQYNNSGCSGCSGCSSSSSSSSSSGGDDGRKNNKKYITQFDTILKELIKQLSFNICTNFSDRDEIVYELPSPSTTTTTIERTFLKIDNFEKPIPNKSTIKVNWNSDKLIQLFKPISKLINSFKYSDGVMESICRVMNFKSRCLQFPLVLLNSFSKYICKEKNITRYNQFIQNDNLQIRKQVIKKTIEILIDQFLLSADNNDYYDDYDDDDQNFASILKNKKHKVSLIQSIIEQSDTQLYFKSALDQILTIVEEKRKFMKLILHSMKILEIHSYNLLFLVILKLVISFLNIIQINSKSLKIQSLKH